MNALTAINKKRIKRSAIIKAKDYLAEKKLYASKIEKKALKKVRKAQEKEWKNSLAEANREERIIQKKAYRYFKNRVNLKRNLAILGVIFLIAVILIIFM